MVFVVKASTRSRASTPSSFPTRTACEGSGISLASMLPVNNKFCFSQGSQFTRPRSVTGHNRVDSWKRGRKRTYLWRRLWKRCSPCGGERQECTRYWESRALRKGELSWPIGCRRTRWHRFFPRMLYYFPLRIRWIELVTLTCIKYGLNHILKWWKRLVIK